MGLWEKKSHRWESMGDDEKDVEKEHDSSRNKKNL